MADDDKGFGVGRRPFPPDGWAGIAAELKVAAFWDLAQGVLCWDGLAVFPAIKGFSILVEYDLVFNSINPNSP